MPKYLVIGNIKRGGKLLPRNEPVDLPEKEAASLLLEGFLAPMPAKEEPLARGAAAETSTASDDGKGTAGSKSGGKSGGKKK